MIPAFDERGLLPDGTHFATWEEIMHRFGHTTHRKQLINNAMLFVSSDLVNVNCKLYIAGSTLSDKKHPNDIEMIASIEFLEDAKSSAILLEKIEKHDEIKDKYLVDFYIDFYVNGIIVGNKFSSFFKYVGEKTAQLKDVNAKDKRGIIEVKS